MAPPSTLVRVLSLVPSIWAVGWTVFAFSRMGKIELTWQLVTLMVFVGVLTIGLTVHGIRDAFRWKRSDSDVMNPWTWVVLFLFWGVVTLPVYYIAYAGRRAQ